MTKKTQTTDNGQLEPKENLEPIEVRVVEETEVTETEAIQEEAEPEIPLEMPGELPVEIPLEPAEAPEPEIDLAEEHISEPLIEEVLAEITEPAAAIAETVAEIAEPAAEIAETVAEIAEPAAEIAEPVVEIAEPVAEIAEPVAEITEPVAEITEPVHEDEVSEHDFVEVHKQDEALMQQLNAIEQATVLHEEEEEEEEAGHEEPAEKYEHLTRAELLKNLEEVVGEEDVQKIKARVALIKVAFLRLTRELQQGKLDEFIKAGGNRESFEPQPDAEMDRFNQVFDIYKKNKAKFNEEQEVLKIRNLDSKKQILEELKVLVSSEESLKKTYDRFKELQTQWKEIGLVPSTEINNLWQNYHFLVEKFFDKVKISKELRDLDLKKNLEMKIELCEKAEELLIEPSILRSFKQLQKYHEEWREVGPVPPDKRDEIWERFKTATDRINERRRDHYTSMSQQQETNLVAKSALCDKAEQVVSQEFNTIKEWQDATRQIDELFSLWKTVGPAPKKENDEVWERLKTYLNAFFANKKEYFGKLKNEQVNNFNLKLDICKQAEALRDSNDWKQTTQELIDLQKEWKNIGPVPRKHSDKIWKRFRSACDEFFSKKSEHFGSLQKNERENLDKKLDLIRRVQEYQFGSSKNENLQVLKEFQREWTEIGHVPIKEKDKIQKSFREAINHQLDALNISSTEIRNQESRTRYDSGRDRDRDRDRGEINPVRREMNFLATKISQLKEEISLWENNIGFLANTKRADVVKKEFELKIGKAKEELVFHIGKLKELQESED
jgi:hypothetical protein